MPERQKKKKRTFLKEGPNATGRWPLVYSQNKRLRPSKYQIRASLLPFTTLPTREPRGRYATARGRRQRAAAISAPETTPPTERWAGCQLPTVSSWDRGRFTLARRVTVWDQLPRGDIWHTWSCALTVHHPWGTEKLGSGRCISVPGTVHLLSTRMPGRLGPGKDEKCTAHLGLCLCGAPERLSSLDLGSAQITGPSWDSALVEHPVTWVAWTWERSKTHSPSRVLQAEHLRAWVA